MLPNNDLFDFGRRNLTAGRIMRSGRQINWPRISTLPSSCFPSSISRVVYGSEHRNLGHSSAEPLDERVLVGIGFVKFAENAKFPATLIARSDKKSEDYGLIDTPQEKTEDTNVGLIISKAVLGLVFKMLEVLTLQMKIILVWIFPQPNPIAEPTIAHYNMCHE